ncbi:MAG: hypothetical protein AAF456_23000 [Planctomycetota bacterium]
MRFNLSQLFIASILLAIAMGLVLIYGHSIYAYFVAAAIFAAAFATSSQRLTATARGAIGATTGWALCLLISIVAEFVGYLNYDGSAPYFDGDGLVSSLILLPLFAFFYLLVPIAAGGCMLGLITDLASNYFYSNKSESDG